MTNRFLSFRVIFCPLTFLTTWKIKILKKWKKHMKILSFYTCIPQMMIMMCGSWDMDHDRQIFLSLWTIFCPFTTLTTQKIKILKKWKNMPVDIVILHMCIINENHMMYVSWDMKCGRYKFFSFWTIFCPFIPITTQKIKILKKWK